MNKARMILRYRPADRANHWLTAITFILVALSGLALFHPSMVFLTNLFGGGPWTRILHPFIGLVMVVSFAGLALRFWRDNLMHAKDWRWLQQWRDVVGNREDSLPEADRYNAGQKMLFWVMIACLVTLLVSGFIIWQPYFAPAVGINVVRLAAVLHALAAFGLILGIIVHIYAAIWVKGSVGAMTRGYVTQAWARKHHLAWYRRVTGDNAVK
jgi:formate dehydrogenase subunit gamma